MLPERLARPSAEVPTSAWVVVGVGVEVDSCVSERADGSSVGCVSCRRGAERVFPWASIF